MAPPGWRHRFLQSTRGRVLAQLRRAPATVEALAAAVGLTENGVRVHLATLERDGWIRAEGIRRSAGPGKPAAVYALAPDAEAMLSRAYRPLLLALLAALAEREPPARVDALLRDTGRRLAGELGTLEGRLAERAIRALEALGGVVEAEEAAKGRVLIHGFGCPLGDAVRVEPKVCRAVTALLAGALGANVSERCEREGSGGPRCRFEVTRRHG